MERDVRLFVCTAKDCRHAKGFERVLGIAGTSEHASTVECQGICEGPVVGVQVDGRRVRWYRRVRGSRRRGALARVIATGRGRKRLRDAEVRGRRGRLRHATRVRALDR